MPDINILVVDDEKEIADLIEIYLVSDGYKVFKAENAAQGLEILEKEEIHLVLLDIMMPGMNGYQTCLEIRKMSNAPILFLSARTKDSDKTLGFSSGGDDYLPKPFSYNELLNRVKALIRRYHVYKGKEETDDRSRTLQYQQLKIDESVGQVTKNGISIELTDTEYRILLLFLKNRGQIFSAERLYEAIWEEPYYYGANNTVMVHIRNLRKKIEDDANKPGVIKTVWGKGYRCD